MRPILTRKDLMQRAFNKGCDARLDGVPLMRNPYQQDLALAQQWEEGWQHVTKYWGDMAFQPRPLPALSES